MLIEPGEVLSGPNAVIIDCRFSLVDPLEGRQLYQQGHIPGAHYLDLNADLAGPVGKHGGRHPLPDPTAFTATLTRLGVGPDTQVVAYDDSQLAFAARLWWLMRAVGYRPPYLLNGGYQGFLQAGGEPDSTAPEYDACEAAEVVSFAGYRDIEGLAAAQAEGALLVDSRESRRYAGLEEPIDPVAGHIPGAINCPWQNVTNAEGRVHGATELAHHFSEVVDARRVVVYCGSGVTACVNLFGLALIGRDDAELYAGSWSDWCSYL